MRPLRQAREHRQRGVEGFAGLGGRQPSEFAVGPYACAGASMRPSAATTAMLLVTTAHLLRMAPPFSLVFR